MDSRDCVSSWNTSFVEPTTKCKASWTTLGPIKRKAPDDNFNIEDNDGSFDNFEPPLKQFAFDHSSTVQTPNVFKDDFMNGSPTTMTNITTLRPTDNTNLEREDVNRDLGSTQLMEDMEMEEYKIDNNKTQEDIDDNVQGNHLYSNNNLLKDGKNSGNSLLQPSHPFGSIVLSEEVIASMGQRRGPNEPSPSTFLPQSIMNQMYKNAMALVPYSGPPTDKLVQKIAKTYENIPPKVMPTSISEDQDDDDDDSIEDDSPTKSFGKDVSFCDSGGMDM